MCRRGEIYNVDLGNDHETNKQSGKRPVVIVSNNKANQNSPVVTVVPLTARTWKKKYLPTHVQIPMKYGAGLSKPSMALAEQVETLDKKYLLEKVGEIHGTETMEQLTKALQIQIGVFDKFN